MKKLPIIIFFLISVASFAQQPIPTLVKSVADITNSFSYDLGYTEMGGKLYFCNDDGLYVTDGTNAGTYLIKGIKHFQWPHKLAVVNNKVLFVVNDDTHGKELWVSDGTENGTHLLLDIYPGKSSGISADIYNPTYVLPVLNNEAYFYANDGTNGIELWKSDGTVTGTIMLKDINPTPGAGIRDSGDDCQMLVYRNRVYFQAETPNEGLEMWCTDGTIAGTKILKDMVPGIESSSPANFFVSHNKLYFHALEVRAVDTFMFHLYTYDGVDIELIMDSTYTSRGIEVCSAGGKTFFTATRRLFHGLFVTDGTRAGSIALKETTYLTYMAEAGNKVAFFQKKHGQNTDYELWVSDGTQQGTMSIKTFPNRISAHTSFGNKSYFKINPLLTNSMELWSTDGTSQGTTQIMYPGADYSELSGLKLNMITNSAFMVHGTRMFFFAGFKQADGAALYQLDMWGSNINTNVAKPSVKVYPNPATDAITIQADDAKQVSIMNITGATVLNTDVQGRSANTINTATLAPGLYTISVMKHDGTVEAATFVKQ